MHLLHIKPLSFSVIRSHVCKPYLVSSWWEGQLAMASYSVSYRSQLTSQVRGQWQQLWSLESTVGSAAFYSSPFFSPFLQPLFSPYILSQVPMHDITRKRICALLEKKERKKVSLLLNLLYFFSVSFFPLEVEPLKAKSHGYLPANFRFHSR